jgi:hypothetical protein
MELLNYLPEFIYLSATIFAGMGSGTQSGKLKFKNILAGSKISICEDQTGFTVSSTVNTGTNPSISQNAIAYGTGTSVTSYSFAVNSTPNFIGLYGFKSIIQGSAKNYVCKSQYSMIIGGDFNELKSAATSVIIGGTRNSHDPQVYTNNWLGNPTSDGSTIISSVNTDSKYSSGISAVSSKNTIIGNNFETICNSSSISSSYGFLRMANSSSIISSVAVCLIGEQTVSYYNQEMFSAISSCNSNIKQFDNPLNPLLNISKNYAKNNSVISAYKSNICILGKDNYISQTSIIGSRRSQIRNIVDNSYPYATTSTKQTSIIASQNATASIPQSAIISSNNSCIHRNFASFDPEVAPGSTIIGSSRIASVKKTDDYNSTTLFSDCSLNSNFSSIISSYKTLNGSNKSFNQVHISTEGSSISCNGVTIGTLNSLVRNNSFSIATRCSQNILGGYKSCIGLGSLSSYFRNFGIGGSCNMSGSCGVGIVGGECNFTSYKAKGTHSYINFNTHLLGSYVVGGKCNGNFNSRNSLIGGGYSNYLSNTQESIILGGYKNQICSYGPSFSDFWDPYNPNLYSCDVTVQNSFIIGGTKNCFRNSSSTSALYCAILGINYRCKPHHISSSGIISGSNNQIFNCSTLISPVSLTSSVIIGGSNVCVSVSYTLATHNLMIKGAGGGVYTYDSTGNKCTGLTGTFSNPSQICVVNGLITLIT